MHWYLRPFFHGLLISILASGCASTSLNQARRDYNAGSYQQAAALLEDESASGKDRVLFFMERGMIRQAAGNYEGSSKDMIEAYDQLEQMASLSVSKDTASLVINDTIQNYQSVPFERTLLHTFTAKNHLMQSDWESSAIEARRIIESLKPEVKKDYPEDAYSRYMAGFCLSLIGDWSNAALQYRNAGELVPHLSIDDRTGFISADTNTPAFKDTNVHPGTRELIAFVLIGRSPSGEELYHQHRPIQPAGFAEIVLDGKVAGRSYALADTVELAFTTQQKEAIRNLAKSVGRIAAKEIAARSIEEQDQLLGELFRFIMIGLLERPDIRRWETLPRSLQVARVLCPDNLQEVEIRINSSAGMQTQTIPIDSTTPRHDRTYILMVRDTQPVL